MKPTTGLGVVGFAAVFHASVVEARFAFERGRDRAEGHAHEADERVPVGDVVDG
jgi:hypothetical protein